MRTGLIAQKIGMTRAVRRGRSARAGHRAASSTTARSWPCARKEKDGYTAVQLGVGKAKVKNVGQADARPFRQGEGRAEAQAGRVPRRRRRGARSRRRDHRRPFRAPASSSTCAGITIGKGFAGAMKRWNFAGLEASHGVSISHRSPRLDRRPPGSGPHVQEQEDGRPFRRRARDHAEPQGGRHRCRPGPDHGQGRRAGLRRRLRHGRPTRSSASARRMRRSRAAVRKAEAPTAAPRRRRNRR